MSKFPLYDNLSTDIIDKDLTVSQKKSFLTKINKIDNNGHELIYALIRMYQLSKDDNHDIKIPYDGIIDNTNSDISFELNNFPKKLKQILFKFLKIHIEKMKEEKHIENTPVKRV